MTTIPLNLNNNDFSFTCTSGSISQIFCYNVVDQEFVSGYSVYFPERPALKRICLFLFSPRSLNSPLLCV